MRPGFPFVPPTTVSSWTIGSSGRRGPVRAPPRVAPGAEARHALGLLGVGASPRHPLGLLAVGASHGEPRHLPDGRADLRLAAHHERCRDDDVERRLHLAAERRPDVGDGAVRAEGQGNGHIRGQRLLREGALHLRRPHRVVADERSQAGGEQVVLVLGPLGPGGEQVGELVAAGERGVAGDVALVGADRAM